MLRSAILALGGLGVVVAPAVADEDLIVYVQAGWAFPSDPPEFSDLWGSAGTLGGGVGVRLDPTWELVGWFHVQTFAADPDAHRRDLLLVSPEGEAAEILSMSGRDARVATLMGELRFHLATRSPRVSPFLSFGAGWFDMALAPATFVPVGAEGVVARFPEENDAGLGASIGTGLGIRLSRRVRLTTDLTYTIGFTEGLSTQFLPLRLGLAIG